jgi:hypothetical protein
MKVAEPAVVLRKVKRKVRTSENAELDRRTNQRREIP